MQGVRVLPQSNDAAAPQIPQKLGDGDFGFAKRQAMALGKYFGHPPNRSNVIDHTPNLRAQIIQLKFFITILI